MAQAYTRQSSFADGDTITAALFNNEYNQLVNAFTYSSSNASTTGHRHDGTAGHGGNIPQIGDLDFLNKIVVDSTNNRWGFYVEVSSSAVEQIRLQDGALLPVTDSDVDLGTSSLYFKDAFIDSITTTGNVAVGGNLTVTGTTTFNGGTLTLGDAASDNVVFGADVDSNIIPDDDNTYDLGSSSQEWKDLYVDGIAYLDGINFNGTAITATAAELNILDGVTSTAAELNILDGVTSTAAELNILDGVTSTAAELNILDGVTSTTAELNILDGVTSSTAELNILDGVTSTTAELNILDGVTSTTAELNILDGVTATAAEINALDGITSTVAELNILDGVTASATDINLIDGITNGTVIASKAIITDSNKDITGGRNITISGELDAATLDISGDADIDGTLEADALSINGTTVTSTAAELNILDGVTSTAAELNILDGVTSSTAELNILDGVTSTAAELNILDGVTSTAAELNILDGVTSTTAELNILDGATVVVGELNYLDLGSTAVGTAIASKAVVLDSNKDYTGLRNLTITGELDAATLDVSGDVDIDGTLEADAITVNGTALASVIAGTTVSNATLAATTTVTDSTANTNFPVVFHDESNGLLDDTGALRYNPSTGELLVPKLTVAGTTTQVDTVTMEASNAIVFEGATADAYETTLSVIDPTADRTISLPNATGTLSLITGTETLTNKTLTAPTLTGTTVVASLDISGDIDVDGTTNLDVVDIDGAVDMASTLAVGGVVTVIDGSTSAPSITNAGDSNSGIYFPSDDNFGIVVGGSRKLLANSSGITINNGSLDCDGGITVDNITIDGTEIDLSSGDLTIDVAGDIYLDAAGDDVHLSQDGTHFGKFKRNSSNLEIHALLSDGDTVFKGNDGGSTITALTLDMSDAGSAYFNNKVGIGTTSPAEMLHVTGDIRVDTDLYIQPTNKFYLDGGNDTFITEAAANQMAFNTAGAERMRIDASGNVGIGTTSPASRLDIVHNNNNPFRLQNSTGVIVKAQFEDNASRQAEIALNTGSITFSNGTSSVTERVRIDSSGNVGIKNSSPTALIHLGANSVSGALGLGLQNDSRFYTINTDGGNLTFKDESAASERMRIDSSGMLGLGTTPPTDSHATWSQFFIGQKGSVISERLGSGGLYGTYVTDNLYVDSDTGAFAYRVANEASAYLQEAATHRWYTVASGSAGAAATLSERMRIDSSGNVGIGSTPAFSSGSGLEIERSGTATLRLQDSGNKSAEIRMGSDLEFVTINSASDIVLDSTGDIVLDSDGGNIDFKDNGSIIGKFANSSSDFVIHSQQPDKDLIFKGNDGGATVTALTLDMSDAGKATFNSGATFGDYVIASDGTRTNYFGQDGNGGLIGMSTNHYLRFITNNTERIRILSGGNVGIGTTSAKEKLDVSGAGVFTGNHGTGTNAYGAAQGVMIHASSSTGFVTAVSNGSNDVDLQLRGLNGGTANANQLVLDSEGSVGIGTASPSSLLHLSASSYPKITLNDETGVDRAFSVGTSNETFTIRNETGSTDSFVIDASNNVGIGTTSPSHLMHLSGSGDVALAITGGTSNTAKINFGDSSNDDAGIITYTNDSGGSDNMAFTVGTSEAMRILHNGNVGIGTTSPSEEFHMFGKSLFERNSTMEFSILTHVDNGNDVSFNLQKSRGGSGTHTIVQSGDDLGTISFQGYDGNSYASAAHIKGEVDGTPGDGDMPGRLSFSTSADGSESPSERMRIDSSGNLLHNCTAQVSGGQYSAHFVGGTKDAIALKNTNSANSGTFAAFFNSSATLAGLISHTGATTVSYGTSSDARLKDVTGSARGLEVINELNPVAYNWKADGKADEGLIAQEVLDVVPNAVSGSEEDMYQMDYSKLVVHLVAGMKEQQKQIEALQSEINELKNS